MPALAQDKGTIGVSMRVSSRKLLSPFLLTASLRSLCQNW